MTDVVIRLATTADLMEISKFMDNQFVKSEPVITSYQLGDFPPNSDDDDDGCDEFIRNCIDNQTSFVAHVSNQLVGILIAGKITSKEHEETLELANACDGKFADIMKFLSFIERKADVCNRLHVSESLHLHVISVHENYYGNGIAGKLFKECFDAAIKGSYSAISVDCTNLYTSKIAEKFEMKLLSTVSYDEFNEYVGSKLFIAREPHSLIRSYGIKF